MSRHNLSSQEYYVYPILEGTDYREHTEDHPFCDDLSCPCHTDQDNINALEGYRQQGLVSTQDADNIYRGKTLR